MSKFKIGDRVVGNENAYRHYHTTTKGFIGTVLEVCGNNGMLTITRVDGSGAEYHVRQDCFNPLTVKDTKIARAYYKNNINKIENGEIFLKG